MEQDIKTIQPDDKTQKMVMINYWLYLASIVTGGLTGIVGVIIAYVYRDEGRGSYLESHFTFQIRTFWIAMLYGFISFILTFIFIGLILSVGVLVWCIVRCVKGLKALNEEKPIVNVNTWLM